MAYDSLQANTSLWLSIAAYCGMAKYETHNFLGPTEGFLVTKVIDDVRTDTEGVFFEM